MCGIWRLSFANMELFRVRVEFIIYIDRGLSEMLYVLFLPSTIVNSLRCTLNVFRRITSYGSYAILLAKLLGELSSKTDCGEPEFTLA